MAAQLSYWEPEDRAFWDREGARVARRNLAVSVPALVLAFAVWMLWSVVVVSLPHVGFRFSTNQLFWLAAAPGRGHAPLPVRVRRAARRRADVDRAVDGSAAAADDRLGPCRPGAEHRLSD